MSMHAHLCRYMHVYINMKKTDENDMKSVALLVKSINKFYSRFMFVHLLVYMYVLAYLRPFVYMYRCHRPCDSTYYSAFVVFVYVSPTAVRDRDVNYISSHSTRDDKIIIIKSFIRGRTIYINISIRSVAAVTTCNQYNIGTYISDIFLDFTRFFFVNTNHGNNTIVTFVHVIQIRNF